MIKLLFLAAAILPMLYSLWQLRMLSWPQVQVRVLSSREEVTGSDEGSDTGWLHAELEYWYEQQRYQINWRTDLMQTRSLPAAVWMIVCPRHPEQVQLPVKLASPLIYLMISIICLMSFALS